MRKGNFLILLLCLLFFSGCHSFYRIDMDELQNLNENDVVQIKLESGKIIKVKNIRQINLSNNQELEFITFSSAEYKIDSTKLIVPLKEIKEIRVEKFDVQKSIFSTLFITGGVILAVSFVLVYVFGVSFSVGG
ncbi:MAG: hypothetical protein L3J41_04935 [Melioribacteraceae bacterium]|nr:hypothetical protein [Melioribacteraceae bacterium]